jgi:endonuclease/exonuclease/phosphatase (EEP) superfamily protein YafD
MRWITSALIVLLAVATFLPLAETNAWWVRYLDYPRLQVAVALAVVLALHLLVSWRAAGRLALAGLAVGALAYQGWMLLPYLGFGPRMATAAVGCAPGSELRVLVANVMLGNEDTQPFLDLVAETEPDVILAMETDAVWDRAFDALEGYPHRVSYVPEDARFFGMHLLARRPPVSPEVAFAFDVIGAQKALAHFRCRFGGVV